MTNPICCGQEARFVNNGRSLQYFYCEECKKEVEHPDPLLYVQSLSDEDADEFFKKLQQTNLIEPPTDFHPISNFQQIREEIQKQMIHETILEKEYKQHLINEQIKGILNDPSLLPAPIVKNPNGTMNMLDVLKGTLDSNELNIKSYDLSFSISNTPENNEIVDSLRYANLHQNYETHKAMVDDLYAEKLANHIMKERRGKIFEIARGGQPTVGELIAGLQGLPDDAILEDVHSDFNTDTLMLKFMHESFPIIPFGGQYYKDVLKIQAEEDDEDEFDQGE